MKFATDILWGLAIAVALTGGWTDWRSRRLPNWLTVSGFSMGVLANAILGGWAGAKTSLLGAGIMLLILLPVVLLRGLGAGDWKLMGALGAIVGWDEIGYILFAAIMLAGAIAIAQMIRQKRVFVTLMNLWELLRGFFVLGLKPHPEVNLDNPAATTLPFGVAVAAATVFCCFVIFGRV